MFTELFKKTVNRYSDFLSWAKYLIPQTKKEFVKKDIRKKIVIAISENARYQTEAFFRWENSIDSFALAKNVYGVAFVVTHLASHDYSMLEIVMYSRHGYKASCPVLSFKTTNELFEWLNQKGAPEACSQTLGELLEILESEN